MTNRALVQVAVFAALIAALGVVPPIPLGVIPVPITLQSLGVMLAGLILGAHRGAIACAVLLALVAAGMPLLAGARGGLGVFVGPTAGFLLAWPLGAWVTGALAGTSFWRRFAAALLGGIVVVYTGGIGWLATVGGLGLGPALAGSTAFIPGDVLKAVLAALVAGSVARALPSFR